MKNDKDAFGQQLLDEYLHKTPFAEIIERDDYHIAVNSKAGRYFDQYDSWPPAERSLIDTASGRVLDIGCGAGRHSLYLQESGLDVTGIDASPGAVEVCTLRGLKKVMVRPIVEVDKFAGDRFDTILLLGNNFGLLGSLDNARSILAKLAHIASPSCRILTGSRNPYLTDDKNHLDYHELNRSRSRMPGQTRMRVRHKKFIGEWFDYLLVSPDEMGRVLENTAWEIERLVEPENPVYFAVIKRKASQP